MGRIVFDLCVPKHGQIWLSLAKVVGLYVFTPSRLTSVLRELARDAIAFYIRAFGAQKTYRLPMSNGDIAHADLSISGSFSFMPIMMNIRAKVVIKLEN